MSITVDGVEYDDAIHFVKYKKLWAKCGLVFAPLYTLRQKLLCVFPSSMAQQMVAESRDVLGVDKVRPIRPRVGV